MKQDDLQIRLHDDIIEQHQVAAGQRIVGIMTTNTITTTYKEGG